jgi:hypothetical protein
MAHVDWKIKIALDEDFNVSECIHGLSLGASGIASNVLVAWHPSHHTELWFFLEMITCTVASKIILPILMSDKVNPSATSQTLEQSKQSQSTRSENQILVSMSVH